MNPIKIQDSDNDQFYFTHQAGNNEILVTSETVTTKANAYGGAQSLINSIGELWKEAMRNAVGKSSKKSLTRKDVIKLIDKLEVEGGIEDCTVRKNAGE